MTNDMQLGQKAGQITTLLSPQYLVVKVQKQGLNNHMNK